MKERKKTFVVLVPIAAFLIAIALVFSLLGKEEYYVPTPYTDINSWLKMSTVEAVHVLSENTDRDNNLVTNFDIAHFKSEYLTIFQLTACLRDNSYVIFYHVTDEAKSFSLKCKQEYDTEFFFLAMENSNWCVAVPYFKNESPTEKAVFTFSIFDKGVKKNIVSPAGFFFKNDSSYLAWIIVSETSNMQPVIVQTIIDELNMPEMTPFLSFEA